MLDRILSLRAEVRKAKPLVHCMMGAVSQNDCANILLAVGAKPVMADHPREAAEITAGADALVLNLAGITDSRMEAMALSGAEAASRGIPVVIDLVGAGGGSLRLRFAGELLGRVRPAVIKGNRSEIAALAENRTRARGVDASEADLAAELPELADTARKVAAKWGAVTLMSGPVDLIAAPDRLLASHNGHPMLGELTATGCMLGALTGAFCAVGEPADGAAMAALLEGAAGELAAAKAKGTGSFKAGFLDAVYGVTDGELKTLARIFEDGRQLI